MEHATLPERGRLRKAASDGVQAAIWIWFLVTLIVLIVLGVGWGLSHRFSVHAPDLRPALPTLPGKVPEPQKP